MKHFIQWTQYHQKHKDIGVMDMGDDHKSFVKNWVLGVHGAHCQAGSVNSYIDGYVLKCVVKYIVIP